MMSRISDEKQIKGDAHTSVDCLRSSLEHRHDAAYLRNLRAYCLDQGFKTKAQIVGIRIRKLEKVQGS